MSYSILNILDIMKDSGESELQNALSPFSCDLNQEIEDFIHNKAIDFAKRKLSITYLVMDNSDGQIAGYFSLTHKAIDIKGADLSNTSRRKMDRYAKYEKESDIYTASAFLLAQFGKNYAVDNGKRISGAELMGYAIDILSDIQHRIGGGLVYLDAEDHPELSNFYENDGGYRRFGERYSSEDNTKYIQYMRFL